MKKPNDVFCQPSNISRVLTAFQYHVALAGIIILLISTALWGRYFTVLIYWWGNRGWKSWCGLLSSHSLWVPIPRALFFTTALRCGSPRSLDRLDTPSLHLFLLTWLWVRLNIECMFRQKKPVRQSLMLYLTLRITLVAVVFLLVSQTCSDCKRLEGSKEEIFLR